LKKQGIILLVYAAVSLVQAGLADALAGAQNALTQFSIVGDAIPVALTFAGGDPERGRAIVMNRQLGFCLLCHSGPFPEEPFQGTIGPDLRGAGTRWTEGQLRLRIVDSRQITPSTIMPAYYRTENLTRVAPSFRGKPILSAEQIEDVVAFLASLRD
jgi:sulfur-oxidizing protein SoxX